MGKWTRGEIFALLSLVVAIVIASTNREIRGYVRSVQQWVMPKTIEAKIPTINPKPPLSESPKPPVRTRPSDLSQFPPPEQDTLAEDQKP